MTKIKWAKMGVKLEKLNGYEFSLTQYLNSILKTQDMKYWASDPQEFEKWVKESIKGVIDNLSVTINPL